MKSWISNFQETSELNKYPIAHRFRGGIGYKKPNGEIISNFVGHPVHYFDGEWKPITLEKHSNGDLEGSNFSFKNGRVTYKNSPLFYPKAVILNGIRHELDLKWDGTRLVSDLPFGTYEIIFRENGVRELLTIPEPIEGLVEFDIAHNKKPNGLYKKERHIVGGIEGESFLLTKDMTYPLVIDPDYNANSSFGRIAADGVSTYSSARSTSTVLDTTSSTLRMSWGIYLSNYYVGRLFFKFLTSGIPDTDNISQVNMTLTIYLDYSSQDFDIYIIKNNWSAYDPLSAGNRESAYDSVLSSPKDDSIWRSTIGIVSNTPYTSGNLSTSYVSKTSSTYYSICTDGDYNNITPGFNAYVDMYSPSTTTASYRPVLSVAHAPPLSNFFMFF